MPQISLPSSLHGKRPTWVDVDLNQLEKNFQALRAFLPERVKIMAVIKADAYGHGAVPVAQMLERLKVDALAVAILEEALVLRKAGIRCPLLLLNGFWPGQEDEIVAHELMPAIYRLDSIERLEQAASRHQRSVGYHLKINTGMARLGVESGEAVGFLRDRPQSSLARCEGIYTHLSSADNAQNLSTEAQIARFEEILTEVDLKGIQWRHVANSSGLLNFKRSWFDGVRPGLVLYGANPLATPLTGVRIAPVLNFKTQVMQLREVRQGTSIGYAEAHTVSCDSVIGTLPVGYADGWMRSLSNRGSVLVRGQRVPIVGRISMDLTLIDVTRIPEVQVNDEVVLIGKQGEEEIRVEEIATLAGTIPYEILCRIGTRVPRIYVGE